jgi:hypothetical protein
MATAQGRETGQQRAIGSALGISRERVREIVKREERRDQRTREPEEAACFPQQQPNPLQLSARLRSMLAKLLGPPNFTPDDIVALEYSVAMFLTIPNFGFEGLEKAQDVDGTCGKVAGGSTLEQRSTLP